MAPSADSAPPQVGQKWGPFGAVAARPATHGLAGPMVQLTGMPGPEMVGFLPRHLNLAITARLALILYQCIIKYVLIQSIRFLHAAFSGS